MTESDFTIFWITAAICLSVSYALFFWFACRCGMLKDQRRARHLPLWAAVPLESQFPSPRLPVGEKRRPGLPDDDGFKPGSEHESENPL